MATSTFSPVGSLFSNGLRMPACMCEWIALAQYGMNWYVDMPAQCVLKFIPSTHTHILIPFEDSELMGLKVDTAKKARSGGGTGMSPSLTTTWTWPLLGEGNTITPLSDTEHKPAHTKTAQSPHSHRQVISVIIIHFCLICFFKSPLSPHLYIALAKVKIKLLHTCVHIYVCVCVCVCVCERVCVRTGTCSLYVANVLYVFGVYLCVWLWVCVFLLQVMSTSKSGGLILTIFGTPVFHGYGYHQNKDCLGSLNMKHLLYETSFLLPYSFQNLIFVKLIPLTHCRTDIPCIHKIVVIIRKLFTQCKILSGETIQSKCTHTEIHTGTCKQTRWLYTT